jgi:site-specific recombinase XerD
MTATTTALVPLQPAFSDAERLALAGFLAGYRGLTREAYALDLRQFTAWCRARSVPLFAVRRADIEDFARDLEAKGRARATVTRRLCTIAGFYKYAVQEGLLEHSPAAHVRRPWVDKVVTIPLAPRTARAIDLAVGERTDGPVFLAVDGRRPDRHGAGRIVRKAAPRAAITKAVTPHTLRHAFITAALDAGVPLRDVQEAASHADPRTTMHQVGPGAAWTGTPRISSPRISRAPPGSPHRLPATPGGDGGQAELAHRPIPAAEPDGRSGY